MAAVSGTIISVSNFETVAGPKSTTAGAAVESCIISVKFSGTYASADDSSTANVPTAIQDARRDGKTVTILDASFAAPGRLNGSQMFASTTAVSGSTMTAVLVQADASTEWADGALATFGGNATDEGVKFRVVYRAA